MNIKLLKEGWMTTSGSSLLRMMQNVDTPVLDLLVRESLQNSLDAGKKTLDIEKDSIKVDFKIDTFNSFKLANEFEGISNELHKLENKDTKFISISDSNTVGLTGNLNGIFKPDEKNQNLGKLVFQIMKPQENEASGGSWGIGKTVYYRLGIGLVIYYSRIRLENGNFQNRLVGALVEDENKNDGLLKSYLEDNLGAAFFGNKNDSNNEYLEAITDDEYISQFLSIFNLEPYSNDKTGTSIIIPYIDEEKILQDNVPEDEGYSWWNNNIEDYLKIAIFRWYFPRLSKKYPYACRLLATVNGECLNFDSTIPVFSKFRDLYNAAFDDKYPSWINKIAIQRTYYLEDKVIGWFMYTKIKKEEIMPSNLPSPYEYCMAKNNKEEFNQPIICYCRKPGMIINYKSDFAIKTDLDEFVLGIFVLNSKNKITYPKELNLDEYIRKSEKSDHMLWTDYNIVKNAKKVAIVDNINNQIKKELESHFGEIKEVSGQGDLNTVLAHKFGKLLMPEEGYGERHSSTPSDSKPVEVFSHRHNKVKMTNMKFTKDGIIVNYNVSIKDKIKSFSVINEITTIGKKYDAKSWEKAGLEFPIDIQKIALKCNALNKKNVLKSPVMIPNVASFEFFKINKIETSKNTLFGYKFEVVNDFVPIEFELRFLFTSKDKLIESSFNFIFEEDKENE